MSVDKHNPKWQINKRIATVQFPNLLKNKWLFSFWCIFSSLASFATELPNHYIVAFDLAVAGYHNYYSSKTMLETIDKTLTENNFNGNKDYISVVGYTMEYSHPSIDKYVRPYKSGENSIIWHKLGRNTLSGLFNNWPIGEPSLSFMPYGSMQSLAKPYSVIETCLSAQSRKFADKTFLYLITDEVVNGVDDNYRQEWINVSTSEGSNYGMFNAISDSVFGTLQAFNEEFKFLQVKLKKGNEWLHKIPLSTNGQYKIVPYEVVSVERPSIHSITNIPSPLPLQRVRGGFVLKIDSRSLSKKYSIKNIDILSSEGSLLGSAASGELEAFLSSEKITIGDTIRLALTVILNDGLYNGVIISPDNVRYSDGMIVSQTIEIQNEAKVFGVLPLHDAFWWWFPNDIFTAVMVWDLILLIIFIVLICFTAYVVFRRITHYIPNNQVISISKNN